MSNSPISVIHVSREFGLQKSTVFKVVRRLGVDTFKQRSPDHGGQAAAFITATDYEILKPELEAICSKPLVQKHSDDSDSFGVGEFYVIQLEPSQDPGRFKVGFGTPAADRLRDHRCSAPFAEIVRTWPCKRRWEQTAIDCVTVDCEQLHTEVFRAPDNDLDQVLKRCDEFFATMPDANNVA